MKSNRFDRQQPKLNRPMLLGAALVLASMTLQAQSITPVWEHLISKLPSPLPILTNATPYVTDEENGDGLSLMDCIGPMRRYDSTRLLLGIRENGINETDPALPPSQQALAAAYPDRSLIWINPNTGAPLGVALVIGLAPVPLDPALAAAGGAPGSYYWSFDVSEDGYVYSGYKNQILRYAPTASGFQTNPVVVFTLDSATATANGVSEQQWSSFRWAHVRVRGAGANTRILAGGIGPRGVWLLTTADGSTFTAGAHLNGAFGNAAGNISNLIPDPTGSSPDELAFYGGSFPGNSNGSDSRFYKAKAFPPYEDPANLFSGDTAFVAEPAPVPDEADESPRYLADFSGSVDAHPDLDFIVHYSTPSWNSAAIGIDQRPGWLAMHDRTNGTFIAAHQLAVTEADELLTQDQSALFLACVGSVSLYPLAGGGAEILWTSEVYGYGRYTVGAPTSGPTLSGTKVSNGIRLEWDGTGVLQSAAAVGGPYAEIAGSSSGYIYTGPAPQFFRVRAP